METTTSIKPKTIAELLPGLSGILSQDTMQRLTAKKQPRQTIAQTRTAEKVLKPMTIAEMRANIQALKIKSPRTLPQSPSKSVKRGWNSSVKVDKKISHTADGQMKRTNVRKVLNFQPKPKNLSIPRNTIANQEPSNTPKFPKPEFRAKKSILQARNTVRISGICNIAATPVVSKPIKSRMTQENKENFILTKTVDSKKPTTVQKPLLQKKKIEISVPDTPLSNESWKSSCDASFLEKEKEINDNEIKVNAYEEEPTLVNVAEVSPPVSTPFKEYRNVQEYFNESSELENSNLYNDNTIMCFDKPSISKDDNKRDESVIVSLCELLNKATVTNNNQTSTEIEDLLEVKKQLGNNIKMIENGIQTLKSIKESQLKSLSYIKRLIYEKKNGKTLSKNNSDETLIEKTKVTPKMVKQENLITEKSPILGEPCSVIKSSKSPSYRIPKKNLCLRKKVFYKSMPNVSNNCASPSRDIDSRALNMYMKMKEQMNFLNTPLIKHSNNRVPDTPSITSNNLQRQLDKLYGGC